MAPTTKLVSVIIPAYNAAQWLPETLRSAQAQTWPHTEIIVVDDGSTDATAATAERLAGRMTRVVRQPNGGVGAARNRGIREAQGDYVQFLDADDVLSPNKIAAAVELLERVGDPDAFAVSRFRRFYRDLDDRPYVEELSFRDLLGVDFMVMMATQVPGGTQPNGSWLVPRRLLERTLPWPQLTSPFEDASQLYRLLAACSMMRFEPEGMFYYRTVPTSMSRQWTTTTIRGAFATTETMVRAMMGREDSPRTRYAAARMYQKFIYEFYGFAEADLLRAAEARAHQYGGAPDMLPEGGPTFHRVRRVIGWRAARRLEHLSRDLRRRLRR